MKDYSKCPYCKTKGTVVINVDQSNDVNEDGSIGTTTRDIFILCVECDKEIYGEQRQTIVNSFLEGEQ